MKLSIIIVSYNTSKLLGNCLRSIITSLKKEKNLKYEIIVIDNNSTDSSVSMVKKNFPEVILMESEKNLGFAKANNKASKKAKGEYILFLNSDTEVKSNALKNLLKTADEKSKLGVLGPNLINKDGSCQPSAGFFPTILKVVAWMTFLDDIPFFRRFFKSYHVEQVSYYGKRHKPDWLSGACLLIKRLSFQKVKGFDENIFMYGEEVDLCFRLRKLGLKTIYSPDAQVMHLKGASSVGNDSGLLEEFYFLEYFYKKFFPGYQLYLLKLSLKLGALLRLILFGIILGHKKRAKIYAKYL